MFEKLVGEKILVTGGAGFLGRHTVGELMAINIFPTVLTRKLKTRIYEEWKNKINFVEIDLLNADAVKIYLENFRPDIIIHLAGISQQNTAIDLEKNNSQATANLLDAAQAANVKRIVITGTADEYGFQPSPQIETMATMPVSDYALSKNKAVNYALSLHEKSNLPVVVLRPFTIYGENQPEKMFVSQAIKCAVKGVPFEMSRGEQKRDLLFVADFADAMIKAITVEDIEGEIFNVGSGRAIRLRELAEKIWEIVGANKDLLKIGMRQTNQNELHDTEAVISKIERRLNWQPKVSLDEGLKFIIEKTKSNLNEK